MRSADRLAFLARVVFLGIAACSVYEQKDIPTGAGGEGGGASVGTELGVTGGSGGADSTTMGGEGGSASTGGNAGEGGEAGSGGSAGVGGNGGASGGSGGASGGNADAGMEAAGLDGGSGDGDATCTMESDATFCARFKKNCGTFTAVDSCGVVRVAMCGACADTSTCGGSATLDVCSGTGPVNRAQGGTITASFATDVKATESRDKLFDGDVATKWYVTATATPWIVYQFAPGTTYAIDSYTVTSANDVPTRDPKSWRLEGTNDPALATWTVLDTRTDETFASRFQTNAYSFKNTTSYAAYRFFVVANSGATSFQLAELELFGP
jgi:hypothetical protein